MANSPESPASDDVLVEALLEFANGAEVAMLTKPPPSAATIGEIRAYPRSPMEFRALCKERLRLALEEPHRFYSEFRLIGLQLLNSLQLRPQASFNAQGYTLGYFVDFPDAETMLTYGLMLLMASSKPYGAALSRCKLPSCGNFYLARKHKAGGRANRTYCSPTHRTEHHNSADRKEEQMIAEHFIEIATNAFPKHAHIARADQHGDLCLIVDWQLGTDPQRPSKRSKSIELRISREAMEDYKGSNEEQRARADVALAQILKDQLRRFDPEHNAPREVVPPREKWIISTGMINL